MKYDSEMIGLVNAFEKIAKVNVKECFFFKEKLTFMIEPGKLMFALGKNKEKLLKLEKLLNKSIRIIEYSDNLQKFITNLIAPLKIIKYEQQDNIVILTGPDTKTKGLMIGSKAKNLRETETIVRKYFPDLQEIKVV